MLGWGLSEDAAPAGSAAGGSVAVHLRVLRACGYLRVPRAPRLHAAYRALVLAVIVAYLAQECIYAYRERADMERLSRVMFLLLCHVTSLAKQLVLHRDADRVDRILASLDDAVYARRMGAGGAGGADGALLAEGARRAQRFARAYSGAAVLTCTLWITFPVLRRLRHQHVEFPFYTYFDYAHPTRFTIVLLYSYCVTTLVGIANTTMDAFIATLLMQYKIQLAILRMNFESLTRRAASLAAARAGPRLTAEGALRLLFRDCLAHYNKIAEDVLLLQDIFGTAILIQFGIGGWILCMAAYKIVSLNILSIEFASMTLFICCILTELFLYCYYGNEVTVESDRLVQSVYCAGWVSLAPRARRSLVLVMERAKRPLRPAAGHVIPLSLETFLKIIKFSYSFYAVLRQTK